MEQETGSFAEATVSNTVEVTHSTNSETLNHSTEHSLPEITHSAGPAGFRLFTGNVLETETLIGDTETDFESELYVAHRRELPGELVIPYTLTESITATKDTFIDRYYPTMNFSQMEKLVVGGGDNRFRTLIEFGLDSLPDNIRITEASLDLTHTKIDEHELDITTIEDEWEANSTTWDNRPSSSGFVDLTELVKSWYKGEIDNKGLMLYTDGYHEYYSSRTPVEDDQPKLHIEYTMPDGGQLNGIGELDSSIYVADRKDLECSIMVQGKNRPNQPATIEVVYGDTEDVSGAIGVRRNTVANLNSKIGVTLPKIPGNIEVPHNDNIDGQITVIQNKETEIDAQISVNRDELTSSINVTHYDDFAGSMTVMQHKDGDLQSKIGVNRNWIPSKISIFDRNDLSSSISIRVEADEDFPATFSISRPSVDAEIAVPHHEDLSASISVRVDAEEEFDANMTVSRPNLIGDIEVFERNDLEGSIALRHNEEIAGKISVNRDWMESTLGIVIASSMESTISIRRTEGEDFPASIDVQEDGIEDINCSITPRPLRISEIPITAEVYKSKSLTCRIQIPPVEHLDCSITIKQMGLPCRIFVRFKLPRMWKKDAGSYLKEE